MRRRVAERVELPLHRRDAAVAKLLLQQAVAERRLVDHRDVVRRRLVVHAPAAVDKVELAARNERLRRRLARRRELAPPPLEEGLLDVRELARRVLRERRHHRVEDHPHVRVLDRVVRAAEVLVDRLEPPDVVVRVRHDVERDRRRLGFERDAGEGRGRGEECEAHRRRTSPEPPTICKIISQTSSNIDAFSVELRGACGEIGVARGPFTAVLCLQ